MANILCDWIRGHLTEGGRIWTALGPGILALTYLVITAIIFVLRTVVFKRCYRDPEIEGRGATLIIPMKLRLYFSYSMRPFMRLIDASGIPPAAITTLSLFLAGAAAVSVAAGRFALGGWLYLLSGICDFMDGRLARLRRQATKYGALLDSVVDRYAEGAMFTGLAWYYRNSWVLLAVLAAIIGSFLVSYIRARGEGLGESAKVGLMQRPERMTILGLCVALSPVPAAVLNPADSHPIHRLAVIGIVIIAVTTQLTAAQRIFYLWRRFQPIPLRAWMVDNAKTLTKHALASAFSTACDFAIVLVLVETGLLPPWAATAGGCAIGGLINFSINRIWTFAVKGKTAQQARRYAFISLTSALLNAGGVAVLLLLPALDYRIAWLTVRAAVYLSWNFPLHKDYVFRHTQSVS